MTAVSRCERVEDFLNSLHMIPEVNCEYRRRGAIGSLIQDCGFGIESLFWPEGMETYEKRWYYESRNRHSWDIQ